MKNKVFLAVFALFILGAFLIPNTFAQEDGAGDFRYFDYECDPEKAGLNLDKAESSKYEVAEGAKLYCSYSVMDKFSVIRDKIQIKYEITHTGKYQAFTFIKEDEAKHFFDSFLNHLKGIGYTINSFEKNQVLAKGEFSTDDDPSNPHKELKLIGYNNLSVIVGSFDVYFFPGRYYQLDSSISSEKMESIVKNFSDDIPYPEEDKVILMAQAARERIIKKEEEILNRPELEKKNTEWVQQNNEKRDNILERKNIFSKLLCLVFDGVGAKFDFLEKLGIKEPYITCAYILYDEVASSKTGESPKPTMDEYLEEPDQTKDFCITERTKAVFRPRVENWLTPEIRYDVADIEVCKNLCLQSEEALVCE